MIMRTLSRISKKSPFIAQHFVGMQLVTDDSRVYLIATEPDVDLYKTLVVLRIYHKHSPCDVADFIKDYFKLWLLLDDSEELRLNGWQVPALNEQATLRDLVKAFDIGEHVNKNDRKDPNQC